MLRGIYTAANAMSTKQDTIETITNNIANTDTTAYKKDEHITEAFSEKLLYKRQDSLGYIRNVPNRVKVNNTKLKSGQTQVNIDITRGYLQLEDRNGKGYYRSATLVKDEQGYLRTAYREYNSDTITKFGASLLDENGEKIQLKQGSDGEIAIDTAGNLTVGNRAIAKVIVPEARKSIGTINSGTITDRVMTNYNQGAQELTENPMHISLEGEGFFKVKLADTGQVKSSRSGAFTMDKDRNLTDFLGNYVLSVSGRPIQLPEYTKEVEFKKNGGVFIKNDQGYLEEVDMMDIVDISNKEDMQKYGHSYLQMISGTKADELPFQGKVLQGYLERSNVNPIDEMVNMIAMYRGFETDQKVINTYDQILDKAVNNLGQIQ